MDIVIISQYLRNIECFDGNNSRFVYIAKLLARSEENKIEIITSDFNHVKKVNFNHVGKLNKIKITTCHEPGYPKNVSLKRFASHKKLSTNIKKYLEKRKKPDVIYCAIPSLSVGKVVAKYAEKNNIRFIIDVQDLWPEAFKMIFNIPLISDLIFYPMKREADYIYSKADDIIAVSNTYADRAAKINKKYKSKLSVFLGTDLEQFDKMKKENEVISFDDIIRVGYIGTLGHSYDIKCVIDSIKLLNNKGVNNILFVVMGSGPLQEEFENYAKKRNVNCEFTGRLNYNQMIGKLCSCDIAVNPISKGAAQSIINKVGDYAAAGLPVLSTQECPEYRKLVEDYNIGFNIENGNIEELANKLEILYKDKELRIELGNNNRKLAEERFDRKTSYKKIEKIINS